MAFEEIGFKFDLGDKDSDLTKIEQMYQCDGGGFWLLIEESGDVIGCIALRKLGRESLELKRFFVSKSHQGHGCGARLLGSAISHAATSGCKRIRLDTSSLSQAALHLFKKFGFYEIDRYNDDPYAEIFMERIVESDPIS